MIRRILMFITAIGMLGYWAIAGLMALSVIEMSGDVLFKDFGDPQAMAWNYAFMPIDLLLALTGLWSLRLERRGASSWRIWAAISMTLTLAVGLMSVSFWVMTGDYDPTWWIPNLFLLLWPIPFLFALARRTSGTIEIY